MLLGRVVFSYSTLSCAQNNKHQIFWLRALDSIVSIDCKLLLYQSIYSKGQIMSECCSNSCSSQNNEQSKVQSQCQTQMPNQTRFNENEFSDGWVSEFDVPKMDCPSEEGMIRMAFNSLEPKPLLNFNIPNRLVTIYHANNLDEVTRRMESLNYGAALNNTQEISASDIAQTQQSSLINDKEEAKTLKWLLAINGVMFFIELAVGLYAQSTGLIADALDMFADAAVYALALFVVGKSAQLKLKAAHISGWLQLILALAVLVEVVRRFFYGSEPVSLLMMAMGTIALIANITCLMLIYKNKDSGTHMKASWIFSANDVIANAGVILAGGLVLVTGSALPDLIIGFIIGLVVLNGARRILLLR